ncbi:MAG: hypothetical protein AAF352_02920 [Pseudomonadota bacterium]
MINQTREENSPNPFNAFSYDRCLLIASLYPLLTAVILWIFIGNAGVIGNAMGLPSEGAWWQRVSVFLLCIALLVFFYSDEIAHKLKLNKIVVRLACVVAGAVAAIGSAFGADTGAIALAVAASFGVFFVFKQYPSRRGWIHVVLSLCAIGVTLAVIYFYDMYSRQVPIIVMIWLIVIPFINAVFDWLSISVTRSLLGRGQEKWRIFTLL